MGDENQENKSCFDEAFRIQIKQQLEDFRRSQLVDQDEIHFPAAYDNTQRRYIHECAKKMGLHSKSYGKGSSRHLIVSLAKQRNRQNVDFQTKHQFSLSQRNLHLLEQYFQSEPIDRLENSTTRPISAKMVHFSQKPVFASLRHEPFPPEIHHYPSHLPIAKSQTRIRTIVQKNSVVILSGATGSGKSTQVPKYLLNQSIRQPHGQSCKPRIIVTQPRRLAAISLAERISEELQQPVGDKVGYSVRLKSKFGSNTEIIFVTTALLLRWLANDPLALGFSHLVLDEVHERDQYTDFLLILLRDLIPRRPDLRVILMSATIQTETFLNYFPKAAHIEIEGRSFPVQSIYLQDILVLTRSKKTTSAAAASRGNLQLGRTTAYECSMCHKSGFVSAVDFGKHVATCFGEGTTVSSDLELSPLPARENSSLQIGEQLRRDIENQTQLLEPSELEKLVEDYQLDRGIEECSVDLDLILDLMEYLDRSTDKTGGILVFLPGWDEIVQLRHQLASHPRFRSPEYVVRCLHSCVPPHEQKLVFAKTKARKIVLSTNIAETSLTIDDIVYVIDAGLVKMKSYDNFMNISTLQTSWIAKSSAKQRAGRAGRIQPGIAFHLYSLERYDAMDEFYKPEFLRTPLEELCLQAKFLALQQPHRPDAASCLLSSIGKFLGAAPDPPNSVAVNKSIQSLIQLGALAEDEMLTKLGYQLALLPMNPRLGKTLLISHCFGVFDPVLRICNLLAYRDPFVLPISADEKKAAKKSKLSFSPDTRSDHLLLLNVMTRYKQASNVNRFCSQNFLSRPILSTVQAMETQLRNDCNHLGYPLHPPNRRPPSPNLILGVLGLGFYPNLVYRAPGNRNFSTFDQHQVKCHNSSILASAKPDPKALKSHSYLAFSEMIMSEKRRLIHHGSELSDLMLLLFIGLSEKLAYLEQVSESAEEEVGNTKPQAALTIDEKISFILDARVAEQLVELRRRIRCAINLYIDTRGQSKSTDEHLHALVAALMAEEDGRIQPTRTHSHNHRRRDPPPTRYPAKETRKPTFSSKDRKPRVFHRKL